MDNRKIRDSIIVVSLTGVLLVSAMSTNRLNYESSEYMGNYNLATAGAINVMRNALVKPNLTALANEVSIVGASLDDSLLEELENPNETPEIVLASTFEDCETNPIIAKGTDYDAYVAVGSVNVRSTPENETDDNKVDTIPGGTVVTIVGEVISNTDDNEWVRIQYEGSDSDNAYICKDYLEEKICVEDTYNNNWTGKVLNKHDGSVMGPSGKETYYNLDMSRCIKYVNALGYYGDYWVREDGTKMLGNNVMCACNLKVHPKGSLVETSLGTAIVVDTGEFAASNPNQIDICTTWKKSK